MREADIRFWTVVGIIAITYGVMPEWPRLLMFCGLLGVAAVKYRDEFE